MSASLNTTMTGPQASVCYRPGDLAAEKIRKTFTYFLILVVSLTGKYLSEILSTRRKLCEPCCALSLRNRCIEVNKPQKKI